MYEYRAKVLRVVDGDTVDFEVDLGFRVSVKVRTRLEGVDTPERGHQDWTKAKDMCAELLRSTADVLYEDEADEEWWVTIQTYKTGKYGRWITKINGVTDKLAEIWPLQYPRR